MKIFAVAWLFFTAVTIGIAGAQENSGIERGHRGPAMGEGHGPGHRMDGRHSMVRHRYVMSAGLPEQYQGLSNPLTATNAELADGQRIYLASCSACHGETGLGDGPAGAALEPLPSRLSPLPRMPMMSSDAYLYWSVAEGGAPVETAMPAYRETLTADEIWSVILYLRGMQ